MSRWPQDDLDLTAAEQDRVRGALRYLRLRLGTREMVGKALGFRLPTMRHVLAGDRAVTVAMAFRVARFAKVPLEDLLSGKYPPANVCPHCGHELPRAAQ